MTGHNNVYGIVSNFQAPERAFRELVEFLSEKGYDRINPIRTVAGTGAVNFSKCAKIENVVNELASKVERLGCDALRNMELYEYDSESRRIVSRYRDGRVIRSH